MVGCRLLSLPRATSSCASVAAWNASLALASSCSACIGGAFCASCHVEFACSAVSFTRFCCMSSISLLMCVRLNLKRLRLVELVGMCWDAYESPPGLPARVEGLMVEWLVGCGQQFGGFGFGLGFLFPLLFLCPFGSLPSHHNLCVGGEFVELVSF